MGANSLGRKVAYLALQATREGQASHAHVHEIIAGLRSRGWRVELYEPGYASRKDEPGPIARAIEFAKIQLRLFRSERPDLLYIRHHFAAWPSALWARLNRIPVVQEVNGPYEDLFVAWPWTAKLRGLFVFLLRTQIRWADLVIAVTPGLAHWASREGARWVEVVPNGANVTLFRPDAPLEVGIDLPDNYVVFFGALAPWQGIDTMLSAIQMSSWPREVALVIVGDGAERPKVEEAVRIHHPRVVYLGKQPYRAMPGIIARSLAVLSVQESGTRRLADMGTFPLKLFEAMACGVPVVVSDLPGMAHLVRESGSGLIVPPGDPQALAETVRRLFYEAEERRRMGIRGRELVEKAHSWDHRAAETQRLLLRLLEGKAKGH